MSLTSPAVIATPRMISPARRWMKRYGLAAAGGVIIVGWLLAALFAPWVSPFDPNFVDVANRLKPPSALHWLGTDALGRDVLSRIIFGARVSLTVGLVVVLVGGLFGTLLGALAAYARGWAEEALMRVTDLVFCFPPIILAMAIAMALGGGLGTVIVAIAVTRIPFGGRVIRSVVLSLKEMQYVEAARGLGASHKRLMFRHILPQCVAPYLSLATTHLGVAIVIEASLGFLGVGIPPPNPTWGNMLSDALNSGLVPPWWLVLFPGLAITLTVLAFNLLGDGIRDMLDPRLRGSV